ncbi:MAG: enoyl-CoA hydratase/isomerase family protein [Cytophagales bacterium]|nr:enoyl-CoA hydratase/isomerase family protein [Cytophagales bacterium]
MRHLLTSVTNSIARITLNRPEVRNAFNDDVITELTEAFNDMGKREDVRCIVLAAEGLAFCAGADLNWMRRMADYSYDENLADAGKLAAMLHTIATCPKPTVARVQGDVYAGGTGLVAACDMTVAIESAQFCISEVKIGLIPATISPYLIRAMGVRAAQRYWLTAERFCASDAHRMGLVSEVVSMDVLDASVDKLCKALCSASPDAISSTKRLIDAVVEQPITHELIAHTVKEIALARTTPQGREGVQAFLQKRPPSWL